MKVKELIAELEKLNDPEAEIRVLFPLPNRPHVGGNLEPIHSVLQAFDQDTNRANYMIDTGIGEEGRFQKWQKEREDNA